MKKLRWITSLFYGSLTALGLLLVACDEDDKATTPAPTPINTGDADFSRYVAIGNSLTAGFQSNALSERDQAYSYPSLIAQHIGVPDFQQPLMRDPGVGARKRLVSLTGPIIVDETGVDPTDPTSNLNVTLARPYDNLGIPGAIVYDMLDTTDFGAKSVARGNPFFALILRDQALGKSIVEQALALSPTFITV